MQSAVYMIPHNKTRWNSVVNIDLKILYIMGKRLFLICFLFSTISLQAQVELTLDDCIRLGWKQNPEIKNSALRIKGARADYVASIGAFFTTCGGRCYYRKTLRPFY